MLPPGGAGGSHGHAGGGVHPSDLSMLFNSAPHQQALGGGSGGGGHVGATSPITVANILSQPPPSEYPPTQPPNL